MRRLSDDTFEIMPGRDGFSTRMELTADGVKPGASFQANHGQSSNLCIVTRITEVFVYFLMPHIGQFEYREKNVNAIKYLRKKVWVLDK